MKLVARIASVLFAAAALTACGSIHPGAAVVVDGESISMKTLDERVESMCLWEQATSQQAQADNKSTRRQRAAMMLALRQVAADVIKERGLTVDESLASLPSDFINQLPEVFGDRADDVLAMLTDTQRLNAEYVAIGAAQTGRTPNADILDPLAQAGQTYVQDAFADHDVEFASRLGISDGGSPLAGFGSLSIAPPETDAPAISALVESEQATCSS